MIRKEPTVYPPHESFMHVSLGDIEAFPLNDDDVIISGFPKSGTNWMQVIVANLWDDWTTCAASERGQVPNLAGVSASSRPGYAGYEECAAVGSPRLMKVHLPVDFMPARWPGHGRVIHITRNPKDVCVSLFHEIKGVSRYAPESPIAVPHDYKMRDFVRRFVNGDVPYGPYVENVIGWRRMESPNLLKITYEDARFNTRGTVMKIVDFVGKPVSQSRIDEVIAQTQFDRMKTNDIRFQINHQDLREDGEATAFMRKGAVGDWREEMSLNDSEFLDHHLISQLEASEIFLTYQ
jgi:hypothetical protein